MKQPRLGRRLDNKTFDDRVMSSCGLLFLHFQFATIELRRREIEKHRQAQKKREHSQEEAEKDAIRKTVEGEKAWAETER